MDVTAERVIALVKKWKPFAWFPEDDNNYKSAAPFILKRMFEEKAFLQVCPMSPHGHDKAAKAQSFQGMASMGRVWLPDTPEGDYVLDEYVKFPAGAHDEEVDNGAIIGRALQEAHPALVKMSAPPPQSLAEEDWKKVFADKGRQRAVNKE